MNRFLFCFCLLFLNTHLCFAQADTTYLSLVAKAGLLHLQKNYKTAIPLYEEAFLLQKPLPLDLYKAAGVYALDSNADKAFAYLETALTAGFREADWLSFDPYFSFLREGHTEKWKQLEQKAFALEKEYEKTLKHPQLRKQINLMTLTDQRLRYKRIQNSNDSARRLIDEEIMISDRKNLEAVKTILAKYGWPKLSEIGKDGQNKLWLVVQHSDGDIIFQRSALAQMEKIKSSGELNLDNYAFLYDRVQCNLNFKQVYGTQVIWSGNGTANGFRAVIREDSVDERRKLLGLSSMKIYALSYGFSYKPLTAEQAIQNDASDRAYCKSQIDSALHSFAIKNFKNVDKYYFNASVVLSGMTNEENYEAAQVFAKIAAVSTEQKYKDLSLDFLNLLYLRGFLKKPMLQKEAAFKILQKERRWIDIINALR